MVAVQFVNEDGTVLASDVMDGNTSDIDWNRRVVEIYAGDPAGPVVDGSVVADSKLMCAEHFKNLMEPQNRVWKPVT